MSLKKWGKDNPNCISLYFLAFFLLKYRFYTTLRWFQMYNTVAHQPATPSNSQPPAQTPSINTERSHRITDYTFHAVPSPKLCISLIVNLWYSLCCTFVLLMLEIYVNLFLMRSRYRKVLIKYKFILFLKL